MLWVRLATTGNILAASSLMPGGMRLINGACRLCAQVVEHNRECLRAYHTVVFKHVWGICSGTVDITDTTVIEEFLITSG